MRAAALLAVFLTAFVLAFVSFSLSGESTRSSAAIEPTQVRMPAEDHAALAEFIETLDPRIMKACVAQHDSGAAIDLDYLATCGDFDLYARYMRISKFEAVKKFEHVLLYSSSRLEFEHKLSR